MNKTELAKKIADRGGYVAKDVRDVIDLYETIIIEAMKSGDEVKTGIVTFTVRDTKPRLARNLHTGETMMVPEGKRVAVKLSKPLKASVKE